MLKAIFFDLDGTLLPMNEDDFVKLYFKLLTKKLAPLGYEPKKLIDVIWGGTKAMYGNDGTCLNRDVFWDFFKNAYKIEEVKDMKYFDDFYLNEFKQTKSAVGENPYASKIIDFCKSNNLKVFLTTNPIFPEVATYTRMGYIGLNKEDFELVTTYDNSYYTKPNPLYFETILKAYSLKPEEVLVFGNNTLEDGYCANKVGLKCYIVGDYVIDEKGIINNFEHIKISQIIETIKKYL